MLTVIYPAVLTLIVLSFFDEKIKNDWVIRLATLGALAASLLKALSGWVPALGFVNQLPLNSLDFGWLTPAVLCGLLGLLIPMKQTEEKGREALRR